MRGILEDVLDGRGDLHQLSTRLGCALRHCSNHAHVVDRLPGDLRCPEEQIPETIDSLPTELSLHVAGEALRLLEHLGALFPNPVEVSNC